MPALHTTVGDFDCDCLTVASCGSLGVGADTTESGTFPIDLTVDGFMT